jgi:hypothetical protein
MIIFFTIYIYIYIYTYTTPIWYTTTEPCHLVWIKHRIFPWPNIKPTDKPIYLQCWENAEREREREREKGTSQTYEVRVRWNRNSRQIVLRTGKIWKDQQRAELMGTLMMLTIKRNATRHCQYSEITWSHGNHCTKYFHGSKSKISLVLFYCVWIS